MMFFFTTRQIIHQLNRIEEEIYRMSTGLDALTQVETDLETTVADNTTAVTNLETAFQAQAVKISDLEAAIASLNSEDPQVQAIADKFAALKTAIQSTNAAAAAILSPAPAV